MKLNHDHALDWFLGLMIVAALYMCARPSSSAPAAIKSIFSAITSLTSIATDNPAEWMKGVIGPIGGGVAGAGSATVNGIK